VPVTLDDIWLEYLREECALAVIAWLKGSINLDRPVRSLRLSEFRGMAEAATSRWIVLVSQRMKEKPVPEEAKSQIALLY